MVTQTVVEMYVPPHEVTASHMFWFNNGPWKRTQLFRDAIPYNLPLPRPWELRASAPAIV